MQKFIAQIEEEKPEFLENMTEECYLLNTALEVTFCRQFVHQAQLKNALVLFYGDDAVEIAARFGADGVMLDLGADGLKEKMITVRKALGVNSVVGLITRNRRHESMVVSEAEPDFVVFKVWRDGIEKLQELTEWYNDFFLIQSAAWVMDDNVDATQLATDIVIRRMN